MPFEYILLIPNLGAKGKRLREKLLSMSFGDMNSAGSYGGSMSRSPRNANDVHLTMFLNEDTHNLYTKAAKGDSIPEMRIEANDSTPTTLKTTMVYDFKDLLVASFQLSGSHGGKEDVTITVSFRYASVKSTYYK